MANVVGIAGNAVVALSVGTMPFARSAVSVAVAPSVRTTEGARSAQFVVAPRCALTGSTTRSAFGAVRRCAPTVDRSVFVTRAEVLGSVSTANAASIARSAVAPKCANISAHVDSVKRAGVIRFLTSADTAVWNETAQCVVAPKFVHTRSAAGTALNAEGRMCAHTDAVVSIACRVAARRSASMDDGVTSAGSVFARANTAYVPAAVPRVTVVTCAPTAASPTSAANVVARLFVVTEKKSAIVRIAVGTRCVCMDGGVAIVASVVGWTCVHTGNTNAIAATAEAAVRARTVTTENAAAFVLRQRNGNPRWASESLSCPICLQGLRFANLHPSPYRVRF